MDRVYNLFSSTSPVNIKVSEYPGIIRIIFKKFGDMKRFSKEFNILQCASISYFPFLGWIYPLIKRKDNLFCVHHLKQGFVISVIFVAVALFLNLINIFLPAEWRYFRLGFVILIYLVYLFYFIFCIAAIKTVLTGKAFRIEMIKRFTDMIEL